MKKIMITGATGLLGRALCKILSPRFDVIGTGFSRATAPNHKLDLGNQAAVIEFLDTHQPQVLIHAAAERKPDVCEQDPKHTLALNVAATKQLAELCAERQIQLFFISTDYVFDGTTAPYHEKASTNPVNFYGQSKDLAEQAVAETSATHCIIRVPVLYGEVNALTESAVTVIAKQVAENPESEHDNWAIRYPTHVEDIAATLGDLIDTQQASGIYHISDDQAMTKYQMAKIAARLLSIDETKLTPQATPTQTANRPQNCALKDTRLTQLGIKHRRSFESALAEAIAPHLNQQ